MKNANHPFYLKLLDIQLWKKRQANEMHKPKSQKSLTREEKISQMDWKTLELTVANCQDCELYKTRTHAVFGVGNQQARLMIIGEAPGAHEDQQGVPFVGRAGQLLTAMLQAIGLERTEVYIANILKSRPPRNRDPSPEEVKTCTPYLLRQIALLQPKLILALGRIAAHYLLETHDAMSQLRGKEFLYGKIPLLVTYHPAYLLRAPREKRKAWQDMQLVKQFLINDP